MRNKLAPFGCLGLFVFGLVISCVLGGTSNFRLPPKAEATPTPAQPNAAEATPTNSPEHCLGWDDSLWTLKEAVKRQLRNPASFEHVETTHSPVGPDGKFGLIMTFRAQNGFGGMNVDAVGVLVDVKTCSYRVASNRELARRL